MTVNVGEIGVCETVILVGNFQQKAEMPKIVSSDSSIGDD